VRRFRRHLWPWNGIVGAAIADLAFSPVCSPACWRQVSAKLLKFITQRGCLLITPIRRGCLLLVIQHSDLRLQISSCVARDWVPLLIRYLFLVVRRRLLELLDLVAQQGCLLEA
jgi:hypothetical protein